MEPGAPGTARPGCSEHIIFQNPNMFAKLFRRIPRRDTLDDMRKTLLLVVCALSLLGSLSVHADPPGPTCPPICKPGQTDQGNGN